MTISKMLFDRVQYIKRAEGERIHNDIYRGKDLGVFNDTFEQEIQDGTFDNEYIGDTFTMGGHKYAIGGFNYKYGHENNQDLGNHILMVTDILSDHYMNPSNTTNGGFAGSSMFKDELPKVEAQLKSDWGDHLLPFNSYLSTSIDSNGAPNQGAWFNLTANLMNSTMVFGSPQYSNNNNGMKYNMGDEDDILPLFKLQPNARDLNHWWWLRDVNNFSSFAAVHFGSASCNAASNVNSVRAFFLIN